MLKYMNLLDDKYIIEATPKSVRSMQKKKSKRPLSNWLRYGTLAASFVIVVGIGLLIPHLRLDEPVTPLDTELNIGELTFPPETLKNPNSYTNPDTHKEDIGTDLPIGGEHMGDDLFSPYVALVDMVVYSKGTFSENYGAYMGEFDEMEGKWKNDRPSVMYHLSKTMNLTREDLEKYYASLDIENVPEDIYVGLLADSVEESMKLLKSKYAFYHDGKLYTVYDVYKLNCIQSESPDVPFDPTAEEYDQVWLNIDEYLDSPNAYDVGDNIREYVDEIVEEIECEIG